MLQTFYVTRVVNHLTLPIYCVVNYDTPEASVYCFHFQHSFLRLFGGAFRSRKVDGKEFE